MIKTSVITPKKPEPQPVKSPAEKNPIVPIPQPPPPVTAANSATAHLVAAAGAKLHEAKSRVDDIAAAIRVEQQRSSDLKRQHAKAVDAMEAALQEHDTAIRNHQAAQAVPVK